MLGWSLGGGVYSARAKGLEMRYAIVGAMITCFAFSANALAGVTVRTVANPKGDGDPGAMTCRTPREIGGSAHIPHYGPKVCATNQVWAELIKGRKSIDAGGNVVSAWMSTTIIGPANSMNSGPPAYYVGSQ
jgi:hypothetical protein